MTGEDFRAIRLANNITQLEFSNKLGYSTTSTIRKVEKSSFVPFRYIKVLSEMIGINLQNDKILENVLSNLPEEAYHKYKVYKRSFLGRHF